MKKKIFNGVIILLWMMAMPLGIHAADTTMLKSPDGNLVMTFRLSDKGQPVYELSYKGKAVIKPSTLGLELKDLHQHVYINASGSSERVEVSAKEMTDLQTGFQLKDVKTSTFDQTMQQAITDYCKAGGRVFVSGSYVATDIFQNPLVKAEDADKKFAREILKYEWRDDKAACEEAIKTVASPLTEERADYSYYNKPNEESYVVESPDAIVPSDPAAYTCFRYSENNLPAGVVFGGNNTDKWRTVVLGFPFESIKGEAQRDKMMQQVLNYLIK